MLDSYTCMYIYICMFELVFDEKNNYHRKSNEYWKNKHSESIGWRELDEKSALVFKNQGS